MLNFSQHLPKFLKPEVVTCLENLEYPHFCVDELLAHPEFGQLLEDLLRITKLKRASYAGLYLKTAIRNKSTGVVSKRKTQHMLTLGHAVDSEGNLVKSMEQAKYILISFPSWMVKCFNSGNSWETEEVSMVLKSAADESGDKSGDKSAEEVIIRDIHQALFRYLCTQINTKRKIYFESYLQHANSKPQPDPANSKSKSDQETSNPLPNQETKLEQAAKQEPAQATPTSTSEQVTTLFSAPALIAGLLDEFGTRKSIAALVSQDYSDQVTQLACMSLLTKYSLQALPSGSTPSGQPAVSPYSITDSLYSATDSPFPVPDNPCTRLSAQGITPDTWVELDNLYQQHRDLPKLPPYSIPDDVNDVLEDFFRALVQARLEFDAKQESTKTTGNPSSDQCPQLKDQAVRIYSSDLDLDGNTSDDLASYFYTADDFELGLRLSYARAQQGQTIAVLLDKTPRPDGSIQAQICGILNMYHPKDITCISYRGRFDLESIDRLIQIGAECVWIGRARDLELSDIAFEGQLKLSFCAMDSNLYRIPGSDSIGTLEYLNLTQAGIVDEEGWPVRYLDLDQTKQAEYEQITITGYLKCNTTPTWSRYQPLTGIDQDDRLLQAALKHRFEPYDEFCRLVQEEIRRERAPGVLMRANDVVKSQLDPTTKIAVLSICEPRKYSQAFRDVLTEAEQAVEFVTERLGDFDRAGKEWLSFSPLARKLVAITWEVLKTIPEELRNSPARLAEDIEFQYRRGEVVRQAHDAETTPETYWHFLSADCHGYRVDSLYRRANARLLLHYSGFEGLTESELHAIYSKRENFEKLFAYNRADITKYPIDFSQMETEAYKEDMHRSWFTEEKQTQCLRQKGIVFGMAAQLDATLQAKLDALITSEELSYDWDIARVLRNLLELQVKVTSKQVRLILNNDEQKQALKVFGWDNIWNVPERMREFVRSLNLLKPFLQVAASEVEILPAKLPL